MKSHVELYQDFFEDFSGKKHFFIIAAISDPSTKGMVKSYNNEFVGFVDKGLHLGISICHPDDNFNEKIGAAQAINRAKSNSPSLFVKDKGQINTTLVQAFLKQEAEYLKNNPNKYIKGYADAERRWNKDKEMREFEKSLSETDKIVVEKVRQNPSFIDNIQEYLKWLLKKTKCIKK